MEQSEEDPPVRLYWDGGQTFVSHTDVRTCLAITMWHDADGYVCCKHKGYRYLHNLLLRHSDPAFPIDHINGITWDNRRSNLRIIPRAENVIRPLRVDTDEEAKILRAYANGELDQTIHDYLRKRRESRKL